MKTILDSISTTSGFLEKAHIQFQPGLNCIIGARGTCKSTLIESIRCAFDEDKERVATLLQDSKLVEASNLDLKFNGMVRATLDGGTIKCVIKDQITSTAYSIERDASSAPRLYKEGVKEDSDHDLIHIEIYSQGDLQRIADSEVERLKLIDRPNKKDILKFKTQQSVVGLELRRIGIELKNKRAAWSYLAEQTRGLSELASNLKKITTDRANPSQELEEERMQFQTRQNLLNKLLKLNNKRDNVLSEGSDFITKLEDFAIELEGLHEHNIFEVKDEIIQIRAIYNSIRDISQKISGLADNKFETNYLEIGKKVNKLNEKYYSLLKIEEAANRSFIQEDEIRKQIRVLEDQTKEKEKIKLEIATLEDQRKNLRSEFKFLADAIYSLRSKRVKEINEDYGDLIFLSLRHGSQTDSYFKKLNSLLQGSRLRDQEEISKEITESLTPENLIDLVESSDTKKLSDILNRDLSQMTRLISYLNDAQQLYDIEGLIIEDSLEIKMFDDGVPKSVNTLSNGQKATTLLPLILHRADYPLVFDQPEDDLDNKFIFSTLVKTIHQLKNERQLIFVTHNANIPVLGESENVIVMRMASATKAAAPKQGSVDYCKLEIINLLEGGAEAFKEREKFYHTLLSEAK
jgi:energy-coupling factor transporter ATP-binding protein EcfA2